MLARTSLSLLVSLLLIIGAVTADSGWLAGLRNLLQDCPVRSAKIEHKVTPAHGFVSALCECVRRRAWTAIDRILEDDVVPVVEGLDLVRFKDDEKTTERPANYTAAHYVRKSFEKGTFERVDDIVDWREKINSRLARVLRTHVIKIDVDRIRADSNDTIGRSSYGQLKGRGRRRRKYHMGMMPIIMMGMLLMGSVLVPMGFQFLAVLGGKALILAKMALMMSSIQGLKKIATSGVNYGLYQTNGVPELWHERSGYLDLPFDATYHSQSDVSSGTVPPPSPPSGPYLGHFARRSAVQST